MEMDIRDTMKKYWKVYEPSLESMMLSHDANYLSEKEQSELLSYLPKYEGAKVLELGAGIGRITSRLAQVAEHVTAIDFMETYIDQNKKCNSQYENITYICDNVTRLDFQEGSFDLVFSNWLLMYLSNKDTEDLMCQILKWLKPSGYFFFRESCYHPSGNIKRKENPTIYRTPLEYINILSETYFTKSNFSLISAKNVLTYVCYKGNPNQLCILAQKLNDSTNMQRPKYDLRVIEQRRELLGPFWNVTGGEEIVLNTCNKFGLRQGQKVLNLMSGTGEVPFLLAKHFNVFVHGVEESPPKLHFSVVGQGKQDIACRNKDLRTCQHACTVRLST